MDEAWLLLLVFAISLVSNILNGAIVGGASLIGISLLLLIGLPPQLTMSTYTFGSLPARLSMTLGYWKSSEIRWQYIPLLASIGFCASLIGAHFLVHSDQSIVTTIVSFALVGFIPLIFLRLNRGTEHYEVSRRRRLIGYSLYFLLAAWASFFAAWTGILYLLLYLYFFGFTILEIKATEGVAGLATASGAALVFMVSGVFDISYILAYIPGAVIGGYLSAKWALQLGNLRLRALVWISISAVSIKTLLQAKTMQYFPWLWGLFR